MNRITSIILSILIIIFAVSAIIYINLHETEQKYKAQNGVLDLRTWGGENNGLVLLDGEWEFYPGVLIDPTDTQISDYKDIKTILKVPGGWEASMGSGDDYNHSGTYRLAVYLPKEGQYGLKTSTIRTSARIYMNGKEVSFIGNPSLNKEEHKYGSRFKMAFSESDNRNIDLIVQVSSYEYRTGGIIKSIKFGDIDSVITENNKNRLIDGIVVTICFITALYFFLQWLQRRYEKYLLYFSGAGLFMGIYLSTMYEQIITMLWEYDFFTRIRIQIATMLLVSFCFLKFVQYFFIKYSERKMIKALSALLLAMLILVFNDINKPYYIPIGIAQGLISLALMASYGYILFILFKNIYIGEASKEYILLSASSLFSYWLSIILKMFLEFELGYIQVVLIVLIAISISLLMSHKSQIDHENAILLSEKLIMYDKMKDDFMAKTSHELRTPIHVMINLVKFLMEGKKGPLNPSQQEDLIFVHNESRRLARLVDDLMDASAIEKGQVKIRLESVDIYDIVENLLGELKLLIPNDKALKLHNLIPENFPKLEADSDRLKEIIYNLIHNAIKFTEEGEIAISAIQKENMCEIAVEDSGIGIDSKHINKIFQSQYKVEIDTGKEHGFGLGLSVVKHLVEIHGGQVLAESIPGKGSIFRFTMPLSKGTAVQQETLKQNTPVYKNINQEINDCSYTILIVDDEVSNQKVLLDIVQGMGHNAILAERGDQVIPILNKNAVDLVILDIMLPDISGDFLCKEIRKEYSMSELPILILTASGRIADLMKSFEQGANDFQKKPADGGEIVSRIKSLLLMKESVEEGMKKELQYFYSQISPHFLYNTLNTIIGLSYSDNESARKALYSLSIYLRSKIDLYQQEGLISLDEEIELVEAYLEIEKMR